MRASVLAALILCLASLTTPEVGASKILLLPMSFGFNSRLLNVQKIGDILAEAGHDVTILMNTKVMKHVIAKKINVVSYNVPEESNIKLVTDLDMINEAKLTLGNTLDFANKWFDISRQFCDQLLADKELLRQLKDEKFDLVFVDLLEDCGRILLGYLDVKASIVYNNFGFMPEMGIFYPQITSFVCAFGGMTCTTDEMTFTERTLNFVFMIIFNYVQYPLVYHTFRQLQEKHGITTNMDVSETFSNAMLLINSDFVLEYPRPLMPHAFAITGLFHRQPKQLSQEFETFIQGSAPHGVVVLSFGTLVPRFKKERAEAMARVFAKLKQRVIWRYTGDAPENLGNNTMLTDWFPQNDVLAHPLTKLFITHCGISSVYEAAYNAVPVVAVPLFFDQHYHAGKLVRRAKMGVGLTFETFNEASFEEAIREVLDNPIYQKNADEVAYRLVDQVITPREKLVHLFEYVIRHQGAKHLLSPAAHRLNIFQFYGADVVGFLLAVVLSVVLAIYCCCRFTCCRSKTNRKEKSA